MPCCKVQGVKNRCCQMKCDKNGCVCIQTDGQSNVWLCLDDEKNIIKCNDDCECQDKNAGCKYIPTEGKSCICVCVGDNEDIKVCNDCKCSNFKMPCCKIPANKNRCCQMKCDQNWYFWLKTDGQSSVWLCLDDNNMKCDDYQCSRTDGERQDKKCECKYILKEGKTCIRVCVGDNEEIKLCGACKCISEKEIDEGIIEKKCSKKGYVSFPINNKFNVCMCDTHDKASGTSSDECDCADSSSSEEGSSCNCVCIPCDGEENVCVGINVQGQIEACDDCSCGEEDTAPATCDNKKCDKKNCICIPTRGKSFICVGIDDKGTIMCYSDCTCEEDSKQGSSKSKSISVPSDGASCICVCLDDNRKVTPRFDCSCKEDSKEKNFDGCCCARQEGLPVLDFTEDSIKKAILEDKSTNTSCADCLCEVPKCTSYSCICPNDTTTVTIVKKFEDIGNPHDCNCPEPKGTEPAKCCKR